ncbi:MAG: tRNA (adenosine(37)-N6)-dimethylallyltransferase MiaA [Thermoflexales bacterium]
MIIIIGPTASGKSARAMSLAIERQGEIVSADSRHVYRGMDIGTNKPSPADRAAVPHHLLDLRDPYEAFGLAEYVAASRAALADIEARGRTPILVGGTGQYVTAVLEGWHVPEVPPQPDLRAAWEAQAAADGGAALARELRARDPEALVTIDPRNVRRVIRALEVMTVTGQLWSALQRRSPVDRNGIEIVYLQPEREALYAAADARLLEMVRLGWLDETRGLLAELATHGYTDEAARRLPSMSALGYRQMIGVVSGPMALDDALVEIRRDTRRFIRMQDTWCRKIVGGG